jgi:hypothetical protein
MSNIKDYSLTKSCSFIQPNKQCAGRNCSKSGINPLNIIYINKIGWFCDDCKKDLLDLKLVDESNKEMETG